MSDHNRFWHCYECNAEMRPLMMPDPHCASCNGTFVEMIEDNAADDPRNFQVGPGPGSPQADHMHAHGGDPYAEDGPISPDAALALFQTIMGGLGGPPRRANGPAGTGAAGIGGNGSGGSGIRIDRRSGSNVPDTTAGFRFGGTPGRGGIVFSTVGGASAGSGGGIDALPPFSSLLGGGPSSGGAPPAHPIFGGVGPGGGTGGDDGNANGGLLRQILMSMFGVTGIEGGPGGQWGDYALTNEGLDQIITQLMEQSNGDRPVPAPEDLMAALPREKITAGSPLLTKDCAVCKDEFEVRQDTIRLPCQHAFHDECILPWLIQSGTCPVCRYELVPQPKHHAGPGGAPGTGAPGTGTGTAPGGGGGGGPSAGPSGGGGGTRQEPQRTASGQRDPQVPGAWDTLD